MFIATEGPSIVALVRTWSDPPKTILGSSILLLTILAQNAAFKIARSKVLRRDFRKNAVAIFSAGFGLGKTTLTTVSVPF